MAQQENVLTSLEQYRSEVLRLPRLTDSEERDLERRARLGDEQARQQLIESSLQYVASVAWRYVCYVRQDDYLDLVSVGNLAVVEGIAKALTAAKPGAYLRGVARHAIRRYCLARSSLMSKQRRLPPER
jgi:DNA-directed RNA polymerase specialized sigma subunit